ncbi:MAG: cytochrome P450 [Deltaproteobacteria bacterium]|nr:cytochrome P450 [bacterium]MCB9477511.1 cytochrome P450 [Deltaproteobacteria bacterium]MCB9488073.1 cytochrome P450 [Deltaproteobacteria bacterium]
MATTMEQAATDAKAVEYPTVGGGLPVIGHLWQLMYAYPELLVRGEKECGPLFWAIYGPGRPNLICMMPEAVDALESTSISNRCLSEQMGDLFNGTIGVMDGPEHMRVRAIMTKPFTPSGITAADFGKISRPLLEQMVDRWIKDGHAKVYADCRDVALKVMFRMIGVKPDVFDIWRNKYIEYVKLLYGIPWDFPGSPKTVGLRAKDWIGVRLQKIIDTLAADENDNSFTARIARGADERGRRMSREEVLDNLRGLLFAGHDTSSGVFGWMVFYLAKYPQWWDKLVEEVAGFDEPPMTPKDMANFPVTEALFREVIRLNPPATMAMRTIESPIEVNGYPLPVGATINVPLIHHLRSPAKYDDPLSFRPERWLEEDERRTSADVRMPFGFGPHFCVGYHMAWFEIIQFTVILGKALSAAGLRPHLVKNDLPKPVYFPLMHPKNDPVRFAP